MSKHFILASQSLFPNESEAQAMAERRAERIESIRLAVQTGKYHVAGELVARRMIERHLYASIQ